VGYDPQPKAARAALKARVVDRIIGDLANVPAECDLCILSLPPGEMIPALESLAPRLAEGALVLGTSPVQAPIVAWCAEHLPAGRSYVGAVPVEGASGVAAEAESASDHGRFDGGVMALVMPRGTPQSAIDVVVSLARIMGARAFFLDPAELDAATAATAGLPTLLAAALMNMSARQPGWRDARRLTGPAFTQATALLDGLDPQPTADALTLNRASLTAKLDALLAELGEWRAALGSGEDETLTRRVSDAARAHAEWIHARRKGDWEAEEMRSSLPLEGPSALERMFGMGRRRGKTGGG
jgi:prephenate dehydrogenase